MSYFFVAWWETPDGEHFEFREFTTVDDLEKKINEFLSPDYCGWNNPEHVTQETKKLFIIKGDLLNIIPKEIIRKWSVE